MKEQKNACLTIHSRITGERMVKQAHVLDGELPRDYGFVRASEKSVTGPAAGVKRGVWRTTAGARYR